MWWRRKGNGSKDKAKERLRLILTCDRAELPAGVIENLKREFLETLRHYFPVQKGESVVLEEREGRILLIVEIPL